MKKSILKIVGLYVCIALTSCSVDELDNFTTTDYLYFTSEKESAEGYPTQEFSFIFEDESTLFKDLEIPVKVAGRFSTEDRKYNISIDESLTDAIADVNYSLPDSAFTIKANENEGIAIVRVNLTPELDHKKLKIGLKIEASEDFSPGLDDVYLVSFANFLLEPEWWYDSARPVNFGSFTITKAMLLMSYMGVTDGTNPYIVAPYCDDIFEYNGETYYNYNYGACFALYHGFKTWLLNSDGAPYYDENGKLVYGTI